MKSSRGSAATAFFGATISADPAIASSPRWLACTQFDRHPPSFRRLGHRLGDHRHYVAPPRRDRRLDGLTDKLRAGPGKPPDCRAARLEAMAEGHKGLRLSWVAGRRSRWPTQDQGATATNARLRGEARCRRSRGRPGQAASVDLAERFATVAGQVSVSFERSPRSDEVLVEQRRAEVAILRAGRRRRLCPDAGLRDAARAASAQPGKSGLRSVPALVSEAIRFRSARPHRRHRRRVRSTSSVDGHGRARRWRSLSTGWSGPTSPRSGSTSCFPRRTNPAER